LENPIQEPNPKKSRSSSDQSKKAQRLKVLVLAIDEARSLLEREGAQETDNFFLFRRALNEANEVLFEKQRKAMIFAVLIDTNSQIHDFVPPLSRDPSSRRNKDKVTRLFPPFVLTHTMDVAMNQDRSLGDPPFDYKVSVLQCAACFIWLDRSYSAGWIPKTERVTELSL